ncbi:M6 family metalloprotease domain-containing protein [Pseudoalteromonas sp. S16_S37]|uniref:M6 family metalloprotease domain-containing protein n=1 Tax=Pseudoalteromonas sp. S16_S37 TaxID=2720228 RepID=UPI0016800AA1|nr:M6 family metalloprotease domain-containing protein [Pseudoalteromonas sp. S16_S37]MBD1584564.1 M6 family metalloprotease domain-containing protein [Pseudoalteromonas sp. S16_S37]
MYRFNKLAIAPLAIFTCLTQAAIPYKNHQYEYTQPNGEVVTISLEGNDYFALQRTQDGRLVIFDENKNGLTYAEVSSDGQDLVSTGVLVSNQAAQGNTIKQARFTLSQSAIQKKVEQAQQSMFGGLTHKASGMLDTMSEIDTQSTGQIKGLTIIIDFPDFPGTISKSQVESFLNDLNYTEFGNAQSVRGYFSSVSGGKLDYTNTVTAYYTAKNNKSYYTDDRYSSTVRSQELIKEALNWLEYTQGFDFSTLSVNSSRQIKGLNIFYAGNSDSSWSKGLWPHMASLSPRFCADGVCTNRYQITDMRDSLAIGTFVHESGHLVTNWPDLYDYDGSSEGSVASFGVMGYGAIGETNRFKPTPPVAHFRNLAGWDTVTELNPAINSNAPSGTLTHTSGSNTSYKWTNPSNRNEAFYIEAIHRSGQNSEQLDQGLAIWHVDSAGNNSNEWHPYIQMEHADGNRDPEYKTNRGDATDLYDVAGEFSASLPNALSSKGTNSLWWNGSNSGLAISEISDASQTMSFKVGGDVTPPKKDIYTGYLADKQQAIVPNGTWFQYAGGTLDMTLEGPSNADFDLKLEVWQSGRWVQAAISETPTSNEAITYQASSGYYRITVYSYSGSGDYSLALSK